MFFHERFLASRLKIHHMCSSSCVKVTGCFSNIYMLVVFRAEVACKFVQDIGPLTIFSFAPSGLVGNGENFDQNVST